MSLKRQLTGLVLTAALLAPAAGAAIRDGDYGLPRALPSDYPGAVFSQPEAPREYGLPRPTGAQYDAYVAATGAREGAWIDWPSVGVGAGLALAAVLGAAFLIRLVGGIRSQRLPA
jgi:hypothetical protein